MALNITFDDYEALFPGRLAEAEFERLLPQGAAYVEALTANRAAAAAGYKAQRVKNAVCAVINEIYSQECARGDGGARVTAVSNDGYSETYGALANPQAEEAALKTAALRHLSGTGLAGAL